jgi:hypothetical protein
LPGNTILSSRFLIPKPIAWYNHPSPLTTQISAIRMNLICFPLPRLPISVYLHSIN